MTAYLTLADVVERYGGAYSEWTLREKARRGEIPHLKHAGAKCLLFRSDWLDAWDDGCELERRVLRQRGLAPGRLVRPVGAGMSRQASRPNGSRPGQDASRAASAAS